MIWLLRHGDAADAAPGQCDAERPLTEKGRAQARAAGAEVRMRTGGLAGLEPGLLHLLLRPAELRAIAGG